MLIFPSRVFWTSIAKLSLSYTGHLKITFIKEINSLGLNCAKNGPGRQAIQAPEKLGLNDWGLNYWAWTSYIRARVNNSRSNVYRGGLCKHAEAARGFPYCILWQLLADRKLLFPCVKAFPKSDDSWTSRWCTIGETAILIQYTDWKRVSHRRSILGDSNRWLRGSARYITHLPPLKKARPRVFKNKYEYMNKLM